MSGNILIRGVNWVGDAVMTLPAIRAIRKAFPGSKISLLVKPWVAPLFEKDPSVDEIIVYSDAYKSVIGRLRLARILREKNFSAAILLQNAFDAALLAFLARIPERIGYNKDGRGFLLTRPVRYSGEDRKMHHIDYYLELLIRADIEASGSAPWIYLDVQERLKARETLSGLKRPVIGINPGAAYGSAKEWPAERFREVIKNIIHSLNGSAVLFGITDAFNRDFNVSDSDNRFLSLAGKTTIRELIALIAECDALVTNDSGPMHIGYGVGTPLVAIFGSTDPRLTGPVFNISIPSAGSAPIGQRIKSAFVLKRDIDCSPCFERKCKGPSAMKCMEAISVEEVSESVRKLIPKNRAVFFDRDGTLCKDANFLKTWDEFKVFAEIAHLNSLKDKGFKLIGVSNQSGIGRGIVDENFAREVNEVFIKDYGFDGFYYCPHHPDEHCLCRKPEPGMLIKARVEHGVDLRASFVVGDKEADMLLARAVGAKSVLVLTGEAKGSDNADFTARDLKEAVQWILNFI